MYWAIPSLVGCDTAYGHGSTKPPTSMRSSKSQEATSRPRVTQLTHDPSGLVPTYASSSGVLLDPKCPVINGYLPVYWAKTSGSSALGIRCGQARTSEPCADHPSRLLHIQRRIGCRTLDHQNSNLPSCLTYLEYLAVRKQDSTFMRPGQC